MRAGKFTLSYRRATLLRSKGHHERCHRNEGTVLVRNLGCDICLSCVKIEIKIGRECHLSLDASNGGVESDLPGDSAAESRPGGIKGI